MKEKKGGRDGVAGWRLGGLCGVGEGGKNYDGKVLVVVQCSVLVENDIARGGD